MTDEAVLYNANWEIVKKFKINSSDFKISSGKNNINVDCSFDAAESNAKLKVELRTSDEKTRIVYHNKLLVYIDAYYSKKLHKDTSTPVFNLLKFSKFVYKLI